jgi:hypothetical protein
VHKPLRQAHEEQQRRLLVVVAAQPAQHARQPRVVRPSAYDACVADNRSKFMPAGESHIQAAAGPVCTCYCATCYLLPSLLTVNLNAVS